ncbi:MAG: redoxin domain-containing protein [Clostridia bacterium]|nr:redoxin domain-containing protein [Clostridia bacterium]
MKKFFTKIKDWFKRHKPSKRRLIQIYAALLYNANIKGFIKGEIYTGPVKNVCVPGFNCYSCPGAGAACPLGALQNALASSGTKAPVFVLGIILLFGLILGRTICGFLCPVGLGQELLYKIKTPKLKKSRYTRILSYFKYVLLLVLVIALPLAFGLNGSAVPTFCKYICPAGTFGGGLGLILHPNNSFSLGSLFTWKFGVMVAMIVASIFIFRFFCRFFCPLGALYGFFNRIALLGVKLDKNKCTDCGLCVNACKMDIKRVGDHECINCGECIAVCPTKAIRWKGSKLFVHENAVEAVPAPSEEKPLGALLTQGVKEPEVVENNSVISEPVVNTEGGRAEAIAIEAKENAAVSEAPAKDARAREKKRNFWLQFAAWAAALALLVGALVYYNFIYDASNVGKDVGDECPDFTVELYGEEGGTFTLSEHKGQVTVINFWATWCGPCTEELPDFNRLKVNYPEVEIIAIHGAITEDVPAYIQKYWADFVITFAQDDMKVTNGAVYSTLVKGSGGIPVTVVVDKEGKIAYNSKDSMKYDALEKIVLPLLEK